MTISVEDAALFFKLWLPILDAASAAFKLHVGTLKRAPGAYDHGAAFEVAEAIWKDVSFIDAYLSTAPELTPEERAIILSWKRAIHDNFFIERHLSRGSIFLRGEDKGVFLVRGINDPVGKMVGNRPTPVYVTTTLIPFRDVIITDGLLRISDVTFGRGIASELKDIYIAARREKRIITSI